MRSTILSNHTSTYLHSCSAGFRSFSHRWAQRSTFRDRKLRDRCGRETPGAQGEASPDPHCLYAGTAANPGTQLPKVPLPVGYRAPHHRLGAAPLRDSGEDLVPEPAHQVEEGAAAGEGASGAGIKFRGAFFNAVPNLYTPRLRSSLLPAAAAAARADSDVCAPATGALSPLLQMMYVSVLKDQKHDGEGQSVPSSFIKTNGTTITKTLGCQIWSNNDIAF